MWWSRPPVLHGCVSNLSYIYLYVWDLFISILTGVLNLEKRQRQGQIKSYKYTINGSGWINLIKFNSYVS